MSSDDTNETNLKKDYIDYVRNVLGVKSIFSNAAEDAVNEKIEVQPEISLVVFVQDLKSYSPAEKDLLQKMLGAVKISEELTRVLDITEESKFHSQMSVYLTDELILGKGLASNEIHTYSPRTLLLKPAYKKAAWDELQKVLRFFQQETRP